MGWLMAAPGSERRERLWLPFLLLSFVAAAAAGQGNWREKVAGRVISAFGMGPVASAELTVIERQGGRDQIVGKGRSEADGRFAFSAGHRQTTARLVVRAEGFAALVLPIRPNPQGAGLVLDDIVLDQGAPIEVQILDRPTGTTIRLIQFLDFGDRRVDLDGFAVAEAVFDAEGRARLPAAAPGPLLVGITDGFSSFSPRLIHWEQSTVGSRIPAVRLAAGRGSAFDLRLAGKERPTVFLEFGSGCWHPDGGPEYRLRSLFAVTEKGPGTYGLDARHLPASLVAVDAKAGNRIGAGEFIPGSRAGDLDLVPGVAINVELRDAGNGRRVAEATVRVDGETHAVGAEGVAVIEGLAPGFHSISAIAKGFVDLEPRRRFIAANEKKLLLSFELARAVTVEGRLRDEKLEALPSSPVGVEEARPSDQSSYGQLVYGESDAEGRFRLTGLPARALRFRALAPAGRYGVESLETLTVAGGNRIDLGAAVAGLLEGRLRCPGAAVEGVDVWAFAGATSASVRALAPPHTRLESPASRRTLTDAEGRFHFRDLPPGDYWLTAKRERGAMQQLGLVSVAASPARNVIDLSLEPERASTLVLPPDRTLRLLRDGPERQSLSLTGRADGEPLVTSELLEGEYRVEELLEEDWTSRTLRAASFGGVERPDREGRYRFPGKADLLIPSQPLGRVIGRVLLGGEGMAERGIEVIAYPVAGPGGRKPRRIDVDPKGSGFDLLLPRGLWILVGRARGFGPGAVGPFELATGFENPVQEVVLDLRAPGRLTAQLVASEIESGECRARFLPWFSRLLDPHEAPVIEIGFEASGILDWREAPAVPGVVVIDGGPGFSSFDVDVEPFDLAAIGNVQLEEAALPIPIADAASPRPVRTAETISAFSASTDIDLAVPPAALPWGTMRIDETLAGTLGQKTEGLLVSRSRLVLAEPGELVLDFGRDRPRRRSLRATLRLDRQRLVNWPCALLPVQGESFAFERDGFSLVTDEMGRFRLGEEDGGRLDEGDYVLVLRWGDDDGHVYVHYERLTETAPERNPEIEILTAPLTLEVQDEAAGRPVAGARVRLRRRELRDRMLTSVLAREQAVVSAGITSERGVVTFDRVPLGLYDVEVGSDELGRRILCDVGVTEPRRRVIQSIVLGARASIEVHVLDERSRPVPDAEVFVFDEQGASVLDERLHRTDQDGRLVVLGLSPGTFSIVVQSERHPARVVATSSVGPGGRAQEEIRLDDGGSVLIAVRDEKGRRIGGATVQLASTAGGFRLVSPMDGPAGEFPGRVSGKGDLFVSAVVPGELTVEVSAAGYRPETAKVEVKAGRTVRIDVSLVRASRNPPNRR